MKAERRHELQENTLVKRLAEVPSFSRTYGPRIVLGVILLVMIVLVIYYRMSNSAALSANLQKNLVDARESVQDLRTLQVQFTPMARLQKYSDGIAAAKAVLDSADEKDSLTRAQALIYLGDLNWVMVNAPPIPGAATQPSLQPAETPAQMLADAENAYNEVINKYPKETIQVVAAHFGLAAIAENRGAANRAQDSDQWDKARAQYRAIIDSDAPDQFRTLAGSLLKQLPSLEHPVIDLTPTTAPSTMPTTRAILGPPLPATKPAATRSH